jgi:hypothetical protein
VVASLRVKTERMQGSAESRDGSQRGRKSVMDVWNVTEDSGEDKAD